MNYKIKSAAKSDQTKLLAQTGLFLVWVQCKEYRCLAYSDVNGKWINFYTGKKLKDFVKIVG
jgi:hypothetical protein